MLPHIFYLCLNSFLSHTPNPEATNFSHLFKYIFKEQEESLCYKRKKLHENIFLSKECVIYTYVQDKWVEVDSDCQIDGNYYMHTSLLYGHKNFFLLNYSSIILLNLKESVFTLNYLTFFFSFQ